MTGRHEFVPTRVPSQADCEEVSNYDYAAQFKAHHEAAIAGWDKKPGQHKRERAPSSLLVKPRKAGAAAIASLRLPRLGH